MFSLIKHGTRAASRFAGLSVLRFPLVRMMSTPQQQAQDHVDSIIMDILKKMDKCNAAKLTPTATFEEIGLDSLDQVEAVCEIEDKLGFDLSTEDAEKITSVKEAMSIFLANYTKRQSQSTQNNGKKA